PTAQQFLFAVNQATMSGWKPMNHWHFRLHSRKGWRDYRGSKDRYHQPTVLMLFVPPHCLDLFHLQFDQLPTFQTHRSEYCRPCQSKFLLIFPAMKQWAFRHRHTALSLPLVHSIVEAVDQLQPPDQQKEQPMTYPIREARRALPSFFPAR